MRVGPLPDAEELGRYEELIPGCAERIITMAEKQQAHGHDMDRKKHSVTIAGMLTSLLLTGGALGVAYYMVAKNLPDISAVMYSMAAVITVALGGKIYLQSKQPKPPLPPNG